MNTTILTGELSVFDRESLISLAEEIGLDRAGVTQVLGATRRTGPAEASASTRLRKAS